MDLEQKNEEEVVISFKKVVSKEKINKIIQEAEGVSDNIERYWTLVSDESNLYFDDKEECLLWLQSIITMLKKRNSE